MIDLANEFYVYRCTIPNISDIELLGLVGTSIQTLRVNGEVYFGVTDPLVDNPGYTLVREPVVEPAQPSGTE
jgi:hypothetical protein